MGLRWLTCLLALSWAALAGCNGEAARLEPIAHRELPADVGGMSLTSGSVGTVYGAEAFVYAVRKSGGAGVTLRDDTDAGAGLGLADARLIVLVEGSGDSLAGFRHTARLIADSPHTWFAGSQGQLLLVPLHWSESGDVVREHVNLNGQRRGAVALQDMIRAHALRHGETPGAGVSLLGFSAGTRVIQMAFGAEVDPGKGVASRGDVPPYMATVRHVVFVGSSLSRRDVMPLEVIGGRLINFVNPRDTHFGDRAPNMTPAGSDPRLGKLMNPMAVMQRSPGFGASAHGFDRLPTLTAPEQFDVADGSAVGRKAFRRVNCPVPESLVPYNIFGTAVENDDLDDFLNRAHNHYILVGRGPGGATGGAEFAQYREVAAEFVQQFVAPALASGRVPTTELTARPKRIKPLKILTAPLELPGKIVKPLLKSGKTKSPDETVPEKDSPPGAVPPENSSLDK